MKKNNIATSVFSLDDGVFLHKKLFNNLESTIGKREKLDIKHIKSALSAIKIKYKIESDSERIILTSTQNIEETIFKILNFHSKQLNADKFVIEAKKIPDETELENYHEAFFSNNCNTNNSHFFWKNINDDWRIYYLITDDFGKNIEKQSTHQPFSNMIKNHLLQFNLNISEKNYLLMSCNVQMSSNIAEIAFKCNN